MAPPSLPEVCGMTRAHRLGLAIAFVLSACGGGQQAVGPDQSALTNSLQNADDWPLVGKSYSFNRYDQFTDITPQNVASLKKAWTTPLSDDGEQESAPVVWRGTIYLVTPHNSVLALDGATGAVKWAFPYA